MINFTPDRKKTTELKTLKDIEFEIKLEKDKDSNFKDIYNINLKTQLKQEAIRWIRELEKAENWEDNKTVDSKFKYFPELVDIYYDELVDTYYDNCDSLGAIKILKIFFNITEKDLKEVVDVSPPVK